MIVLLGGTGFLGKHICQELHRVGMPAATISRNPDSAFLQAHAPSIAPLKVNSLEAGEALANADAIIYLVHNSRPATFAEALEREIEENLIPATRFLQKLRPANARRLIYISSGGQVYGRGHDRPVPESAPCHPVTPYGLGKMMIEDLFAYHFRQAAGELTILRLANPVGRFQADGGHGLVAAAVATAFGGRPLTIFGKGNKARDYFDADDFARFLVAALPAGELRAGIYNIGTGIARTERDVIAAVESVLGSAVPHDFGPDRAFDVPYAVVDASKAIAELGWTHPTSLPRSIDKIAAALR